jgi:hypothetical protein
MSGPPPRPDRLSNASSKPALTLRDATSDDLALINDIHVRSRQAVYRGLVSDHYLDVTMPAARSAVWARANGARAMHLKVLETNAPAIGFYESRGWRRVDRVDRVDDEWAGQKIVALVYAVDLT